VWCFWMEGRGIEVHRETETERCVRACVRACVRGLEFTLLCYCSDLSSIVVVMKAGE